MIGLILLPFTIVASLVSTVIGFITGFISTGIRVVINLTRILVGLLLGFAALPLSILSKNLFFFFLAALVIFLCVEFSHRDTKSTGTMPATATAPTLDIDPSLTPVAAEPEEMPQNNKNQKPILVEPVRTREDGNSVFAADLYKMMNDPQRAYYSQFYFNAMNTLADGNTLTWQNGNTHGSLRIDRTFDNKSGDHCRVFSERLKVGSIEQTLSGTGCQKAGGSWCKLKLNATPACNLGGKPGTLETIGRWFNNLF